jgi:hypothetical protein
MTDTNNGIARGKRELLRHAVATLAYRSAKAIRNAPPELAEFRIGDATRAARAPVQLLAHLADLLEWGVSLAEGNQKWNVATPGTWEAESNRFFAALAQLDACLASDRTLGCRPERLLQGPVADALTHVGQLMMLRRLASAPVRSENYAIAEIVAGRVGIEQAPPKFEFD